MLKKAFPDLIFAADAEGSGKPASCVRALDMFCPIAGAEAQFAAIASKSKKLDIRVVGLRNSLDVSLRRRKGGEMKTEVYFGESRFCFVADMLPFEADKLPQGKKEE